MPLLHQRSHGLPDLHHLGQVMRMCHRLAALPGKDFDVKSAPVPLAAEQDRGLTLYQLEPVQGRPMDLEQAFELLFCTPFEPVSDHYLVKFEHSVLLATQ